MSIEMSTYLNCTANSSLVSSSSQLSSQRCVFPPGICVSSSVQSTPHQYTLLFLPNPPSGCWGDLPSAGKSSNSSSSSSCAAGFFSTAGSPFLVLSSAFAAVELCAADMLMWFRRFRRRSGVRLGEWECGWRRSWSLVLTMRL